MRKTIKTVDNYDLYHVSVWIDKNKNSQNKQRRIMDGDSVKGLYDN